MNPRELKRQFDLLFESVRELRQANSDLIDRVQELECSEDYPDAERFTSPAVLP